MKYRHPLSVSFAKALVHFGSMQTKLTSRIVANYLCKAPDIPAFKEELQLCAGGDANKVVTSFPLTVQHCLNTLQFPSSNGNCTWQWAWPIIDDIFSFQYCTIRGDVSNHICEPSSLIYIVWQSI